MGPTHKRIVYTKGGNVQENCLENWAPIQENCLEKGGLRKQIAHTGDGPNTQENILYKMGQYTR